MKLEEIESLVKGGESTTLEFKASTAHLRATFATICAFLNNNGGIVLIGVKDNGNIVGQDVSDATRKDIANEINKLEPPGQVNVEYVPIDEQKKVIVIQVDHGDHAPYVYDGRPYQRDESKTNRMPQQRYDQLVAKRHQLNYSWEKFNAEKYNFELLDHNLILNVVRRGIEAERLPEIAIRQDIPQILEALNLLNNEHLTNAAVVLFGTKFMPNYPQCHIKLARFKGTNRHEFLDSDLIYGNTFELLERGMLFVKRHLPVAARIETGKLERVETPIVPFDAVREALINSLCHRDYSVYQGSVGLAIYENRMEIFNDGNLLHGVTLEKIKKGFSKLRNPIVADVFYKCKLIERWGRGIQEIINSCMSVGDPEPEFQIDEAEFKIIFKFPTSLKPTIINVGVEEKKIHLTKRQQEILRILKDAKELSIKEIQQKIKPITPFSTLRDDLNKLRQLGIAGSHGRGKVAVWFYIQSNND